MSKKICTAATLAGACLALLLTSSLVPSAALAAEKTPEQGLGVKGPVLVEALSRGGYVIYMRHTKTERRQKDKDHLANLADCTKQRNLSDEGRRQARVIGEALKRLRVKVDRVYSSPYCRAYDTARLAFGKGKKTDGLQYLTYLSADDATAATAWLREQLATAPRSGTNTVLVSHTANLKDGLGLWPGNAGDIFVFRPTEDGRFFLLGRVTPEEWPALAGMQQSAAQAQ